MKILFTTACLCALIAAWTLPAAAQTCPQRNKPAGVLEVPKIDFPAIKHSPSHGTVVIRVDLSPQGEMIGHKFMETTGNPNLDMEALTVAHRVKYSPEIINCKPVGGSYLFVVDFSPG